MTEATPRRGEEDLAALEAEGAKNWRWGDFYVDGSDAG